MCKGDNLYEKQANCTKNIWRSEKFLLILHVTKNRNSNDYLVRGKYQELILKIPFPFRFFAK